MTIAMYIHSCSCVCIVFPAGQSTEEGPEAPPTKKYPDYDHLENFVPKPEEAANADEAATTGSGGEQTEENVEKRVTVTEKNKCCIML